MTDAVHLLDSSNLKDAWLKQEVDRAAVEILPERLFKYEQSCGMDHNLGILDHESNLFSTEVKIENDVSRSHDEFVSLASSMVSSGNFIIETHDDSLKCNLLDTDIQNEDEEVSERMIKIEVTPDLPCNFETDSKPKSSNDKEQENSVKSLKTDTEKPYHCAHCGKAYKTKISIIRHIKQNDCANKTKSECKEGSVHKSQKRGPKIVRLADNRYQCRHCDKTYTQKNNLFRHMREDHVKLSEPTGCDICGKEFFNLTKLNQHSRCHSEKSYECSICRKSFVQVAHLHSHMLTHTGEKPYQCHICEKRFSKSFNLKIHINRHNGERQYKCRVCQTEFFTHGDLEKHVRIHTAERPYCCDTCGKRFKQNSHLKKHLLSHTGQKPYKCGICQKDYVNSSHLKRHMKTHTGEKLPECKCPMCGNNFSEPSTLKRHIIKVHRKLPHA